MNNEEIMKGLNMAIGGLSMIREALLEQDSVSSPVAVWKSEKVEEPLEVVETSEDLRASLQHMKYNEFKKYAASLGVKCTGSRDEILERILALKSGENSDEQSSEGAETTEVVVEKTPEKSDSVSKVKRKTAEEVEEDSRDEFDKQAEEIAETTDVGDILEALDDVGIKATKKNYLSKLAEALRKGLIEADDSDEEDSEDEVEETEEELPFEDETSSEKDADEDSDDKELDDIDEDYYFPQYDPEGFNDPEGSYMTDERAEKIHETVGSILSNYEDESLTSDEVEKYIEEHATQEEIDLLGEDYTEEDALKLYIELVKRTIDNDGEEHDTHDPYEIGEDNFCCGHKLKYMKKTGNYYCELCGEEYEAE